MPTKRSLGLRRHGVPHPAADTITPPETEFLAAVEEDDRDIEFGIPDSIDAVPAAPKAVTHSPHDDIPLGHFVDAEGMEWIDRVPAFLLRDTPRSNIH